MRDGKRKKETKNNGVERREKRSIQRYSSIKERGRKKKRTKKEQIRVEEVCTGALKI